MANRFVIAGTGSGVGKTTLTVGLMKALMNKGLRVQGFKCGPDYIDPTYHTAVTKRTSRNIDSWMLSHDVVRTIVSRASEQADVAVIEGVMGFYDGKSPLNDEGSTAEISRITSSPVILVVNAASMARSVAAIVKGFQTLSTDVQIVGVIANQLGSKSHYEIVKAAIEQECHVPVIGYLQKGAVPPLPSRHLGLVPAIERGDLDQYFEDLARAIEETVDLDLLLSLTEAPVLDQTSTIFEQHKKEEVHLAVAKDEAFNFYYPENLELLQARGAVLHYFSPLRNEPVPEIAQGLYIGGGFPEEFAEQLAQNEQTKESIRQAIADGIPTLAECGGFMYCTESIERRDGQQFNMLGIIPGKVVMQDKLAALGYREITGVDGNFFINADQQAKGHEFHYSTYQGEHDCPAYFSKGRFRAQQEGFLHGNLVAGYTHFHFASNPQLVENWLQTCQEGRK
ncbi:cobyrinic acid a,c-diamide synthase [Lysinibacillus composti]|uniref:Cobyrinate a,c-diamide synthase n=1 Tax=Lysinibacillus composti TaxID=720633 RepID=A0A3N9USL4_9BACI|nr:cobyrinate a,c-diamide synthase [Lysinibacillus composti]MBM7608602.1 cobyrinic acid a,c-diamide synthase [Lysinibacillus composti]RQW74876.1 cobyrinate a,c-diamide synthase [Lysinibacillus composti]